MKTSGSQRVSMVVLVLSLVLSPASSRAQVEIHGADADPAAPASAAPAAPQPAPVWITINPAPPPPPEPEDPARTRLTISSTADTLRGGEWSLTWREFATLEVAVGITDWLELDMRSIPLLLVVPDGAANSLWSGGLRLRVLKSSLFTLTTELEGVAFLGWAGVRGGLAAKIGNDRFAFHAAASGLWMWQVSDDSWAEGESHYDVARPTCAAGDCTGGVVYEEPTPQMSSLLPSAGLSLRLHRRVKLLAEAAYISAADTLLLTPTLRLHGQRFACDLGLMVVYLTEEQAGLVLPVVNMSVNF